jgi:hypothetical protein
MHALVLNKTRWPEDRCLILLLEAKSDPRGKVGTKSELCPLVVKLSLGDVNPLFALRFSK